MFAFLRQMEQMPRLTRVRDLQVAWQCAQFANTAGKFKAAVEQLFNTQVAEVNTVNVAGKTKRTAKGIGKRSNWKKAYVTLKEGQNVDFFEV